ncbi:MAG: hypothetical protein F4218_10840 [Synechococcus sp. SB0677_bin_5]|nr:hypothetical protein [Synechococcus sp. SB0677_bin_5]
MSFSQEWSQVTSQALKSFSEGFRQTFQPVLRACGQVFGALSGLLLAFGALSALLALIALPVFLVRLLLLLRLLF